MSRYVVMTCGANWGPTGNAMELEAEDHEWAALRRIQGAAPGERGRAYNIITLELPAPDDPRMEGVAAVRTERVRVWGYKHVETLS